MAQKLYSLLLASAVAAKFGENLRQEIELSSPDFNETDLFEKLFIGEMENYLSYQQVLDLMDEIVAQFPDEVSLETIGNSYEGMPINGLKFAANRSDDLSTRPLMLITALHHPRELTTLSMITYIMLEFLHARVHNTGSIY